MSGGCWRAVLDVPLTDRLLWDTYRYGKLTEPHPDLADPTSASIASNLGLPFAQLANSYENGATVSARSSISSAPQSCLLTQHQGGVAAAAGSPPRDSASKH